MKTKQTLQIIILFFIAITLPQLSCNKDNNNNPEPNLIIHPSVGSTYSQFSIDLSGSLDSEDAPTDLTIRMDWEDDGIWESDWTTEKIHNKQYETEGNYTVRVEVKDLDGNVSATSGILSVSNSSNLIPATSPFSYNVGINYETFTMGRNKRIIENDLDTITKHFKLIKTFHTAGVGTNDIVIDPNQKKVIDYLVANKSRGLELAMGTNNNVLANGGYGHPFSPGLMTTKTYTDAWVSMVIAAFGSVENVNTIVKSIFLGNEIDLNKPGTNDVHYHDFYSNWVPTAFENLKTSMKEAGLDNIPITTIIANYPEGTPTVDDSVQTSVTRYITNNWSSSWNSGNPFLMFNQYTQNYGSSTDYGPVISYFEKLDNIFVGSPEVYIGETGYSEEFGAANQVKVFTQIFNWLEGQYQDNKLMIPIFIFMSFDRPDKGKNQLKMGIFEDNDENKPLGLKQGIIVPEWVSMVKK
jgi:hypothetical protein